MTRFALFLLCLPVTLQAQTDYFQQKADYRIRVTLDDRQHTLSGDIEIDYTNNAPAALREIYLHLWGNAFKDRSTAFCKQKLESGSTEFYFAPDSSLGWYEGLDFKVNGGKLSWSLDPDNPDIARLELPAPLQPGAKITLSTPFILHIPASFSRLGHVESSYQITQWYPKPAVYDRKGLHAMPYLDQGEFFSEFGSFDVEITLPDNYVVGATGMLQTPSEIEFLEKKANETRLLTEQWAADTLKARKKEHPFPPSSSKLKTIRYKAEQVHDFAWFADKRFHVLRDTAQLSSGRTVDCWAMFTDEQRTIWTKGAFYVRRAVEFYSELVGEYPWPHATAVHSALSAGGGMEYPMITVIGDAGNASGLDEVITHEVGHNWFYGILASNERDHPWLDEGLNSYYEQRYMRRYYEKEGIGIGGLEQLFPPNAYGSINELGYLFLARDRRALPPDSHSDAFSLVGYGLQAYMTPAMALRWLERAAGTERFDRAMQRYFAQWRFKHPYPEDLQASWSAAGVEAPWFFDAMLAGKYADPALTKVKKSAGGDWELTVRHKGETAGPFPVSALQDGKLIETAWFNPPASGEVQTIRFQTSEADAFVIDHDRETLDLYRSNNQRRTGGLFPGLEPVRFKILAPLENSTRTLIGVTPWVGWNNYDKTQLGLAIYNTPVPSRRFQYFLLPGFGLGSKEWTGLADAQLRFFPGGGVPRMTVGINAKSFQLDYEPALDVYRRYYRIVPQLRMELRSRHKNDRHAIVARTIFSGVETPVISDDQIIGTTFEKSAIQELRYEGARLSLPNPYRYRTALEWQSYRLPAGSREQYLRLSAEWRQELYYRPKRRVTARLFAGYFLVNSRRQAGAVSDLLARGSFALNPQGFNDYRFDQVFFGRSDQEGIWAQQVSQNEGGFKNAFGAPYRAQVGNSNNFILSLNLKADMPFRLPLGLPVKPWFDMGYYDDATPIGRNLLLKDQLLWSGGLMLEFFKGRFEVYFPLVNAKPLRDIYADFAGNNYAKRITWSIRLDRLNPSELLEDLAR
jgi:hypothetical protein